MKKKMKATSKVVKRATTKAPKKASKPVPAPKPTLTPAEVAGGCPEHSLYKGLRSPRTDCAGCWAFYRGQKEKPAKAKVTHTTPSPEPQVPAGVEIRYPVADTRPREIMGDLLAKIPTPPVSHPYPSSAILPESILTIIDTVRQRFADQTHKRASDIPAVSDTPIVGLVTPEEFTATVHERAVIIAIKNLLEKREEDLKAELSSVMEMAQVTECGVAGYKCSIVESHTATRIDRGRLLQAGVDLKVVEQSTVGGEKYSYVKVVEIA